MDHIYTVKKDSGWIYPRRLYWTLTHQMIKWQWTFLFVLVFLPNPREWQMQLHLIPFMVVTKFSESAPISMAAHKICYYYLWESISSAEKRNVYVRAHTYTHRERFLKSTASNTCLTLSLPKSFSYFFSQLSLRSVWERDVKWGFKTEHLSVIKRQCSCPHLAMFSCLMIMIESNLWPLRIY